MTVLSYSIKNEVVRICFICQKRTFIHRWSKFIRWQELEQEERDEKVFVKKIRKFFPLGKEGYISPELPEDGNFLFAI